MFTSLFKQTVPLRRALLISTAMAVLVPTCGIAQTAAPALPDQIVKDEYGFNLLTKSFFYQGDSLLIGTDEKRGLMFRRVWLDSAWHHNFTYDLLVLPTSGGLYADAVATVGLTTKKFFLKDGDYADDSALGAKLVIEGSNYSLYLNNGTRIIYDVDVTCAQCSGYSGGKNLLASKIIDPDGTTTSLYYKVNPGTQPYFFDAGHRISSAVSSNGYELKFEYVSDIFGYNLGNADSLLLKRVIGVPLATSYCDPLADNCASIQGDNPSLSYVYTPAAQYGDPELVQVTDALHRSTTYRLQAYSRGFSSATRLIGVHLPQDTADSTSVLYDDNGSQPNVVAAITSAGINYNYTSSETYTGGETGYPVVSGRTIVRTDPTGAATTFKAANFQDNEGRITDILDALGNHTTFQHDSHARLLATTKPEGNSTNYSYDGRGNITQLRTISKPGSGLSDLVQTATYDSACLNPLTCNRPISITDSSGSITDLTYDPIHGGLVSAKLPSASVSGIRAEKRYSYTPMQASYKDATGSIVPSGIPTYKITEASSCSSAATCAGTSDETKEIYAYAGNGVANTLALTSKSVASGDGTVSASTSYAYDDIGNIIGEDGPVPGSDDVTSYRYDADRELIGTIMPDPDGAGPLKRRATRTSYNGNGLPTQEETGTVDGATDADWSTFAPIWQIAKN